MNHQLAHEALYGLASRLNTYDGVMAMLKDNVVTVELMTGSRTTEQITAGPRPDDDGRLWLWDSARRPIAEADKTVDAAVMISSRLRDG